MWILSKNIGFSDISAVVATCFFSFSNNYQVQMGHLYLLSISILPWIFIFAILYFKEENPKKKWLIIVVSLVAFLCYSAIYIAQFLVLSVFLIGIVLFSFYILEGRGKECINNIAKIIKVNYAFYLGLLVYSIIIMLPFFHAYLPMLKENRGYTAEGQLYFSPLISDLFNTGVDNWKYGKAISELGIHQGEWTIGFPILSGVGLILSMIIVMKAKKHKGFRDRSFKSIVLVSCIIVCLIIKIDGIFNIWSLVRLVIPGASSMRAMSRFVLFLDFYFSLIYAYAFMLVLDALKSQKTGVCLLIIWGSIFIVENFNTISTKKVDWKDTFSDIEFSSLPENCAAFFVYDSEKTEMEIKNWEYSYYLANGTAFSIANEARVRTLNGIGSVFPGGSYNLSRIYDEDYFDNVAQWIVDNNLSNIYGYDIETDTWHKSEDIIRSYGYIFGEGFSRLEQDENDTWCWGISNTTQLSIYNCCSDGKNLEVTFETGTAPDGIQDNLTVHLGGEIIAEIKEGDSFTFETYLNSNEAIVLDIVSSGDLCSIETDSRTFSYSLRNLKVVAK